MNVGGREEKDEDEGGEKNYINRVFNSIFTLHKKTLDFV